MEKEHTNVKYILTIIYTVRDMMRSIFLDLSIQNDRMFTFTSGRKIPCLQGHRSLAKFKCYFTFHL